MESKYHLIHELGCRVHHRQMLENKMEPKCCMCDPSPECSFPEIERVDKIQKAIHKELTNAPPKYPEDSMNLPDHVKEMKGL